MNPDGLRALLRDGGRGVVDLVLSDSPVRIVGAPVAAIAIGLAFYFLLTRVLETLVASTLAIDRRSLRSLPRIIVVHLVLLVAVAALGFAAWLGITGMRDTVSLWYDRRAADLAIFASAIPALLVMLLVATLDDLAILRCAGGNDVVTSFGDALARLRETPFGLLATRVVTLVASLALLVLGAAFSWRVERGASAIAIACIAGQQICALARIAVRIGWLASLAAPWRAGDVNPASTVPTTDG